MTIGQRKNEIRKAMIAQRTKMPLPLKEKYDLWICSHLQKIIKERGCKVLHTFLPMAGEINIYPLIESLLQENILIVSPKVLPKRKLQNLILQSLNEVEKGAFGTTHPSNSKEFHGEYNLIVVPGLSFDHNKNRLGYGGGYYDNFLIHHPNALRLGIFYPFQKINEVPTESHDVQLDEVLSAIEFSDELEPIEPGK